MSEKAEIKAFYKGEFVGDLESCKFPSSSVAKVRTWDMTPNGYKVKEIYPDGALLAGKYCNLKMSKLDFSPIVWENLKVGQILSIGMENVNPDDIY